MKINIEINWLWDGGIEIRLGDRMNGFVAETNVTGVANILAWLQDAIEHFYLDSTYAAGLDADVRERAARPIFLPPQQGAWVTCPECGAPNPNLGGMDEIMTFVSSHCGAGVKVDPPNPVAELVDHTDLADCLKHD